jgi:AbrB family looped-hinge helix DNA binding protein
MTTVFKERELVVPASIRRQAGIKSGDRLEFKVSGGVITIIPRLPTANDEYTAKQRRVIDARLAKAEEDIRKGRVYGPFKTADEMIASMKAELKTRATKKAKRSR